MLRGLAILGVVAIHASGTGLKFSEDSINFNFTVLWRNFLNFSVPMFLAISGFFLATKKIDNITEYFTFQKKQIPRVYIPFLIWSIVWFWLAVLIKGQPVSNELIKLIAFQSSSPYYFIALIIQYYLLLPVFKIMANSKWLAFSVLISIAFTFLIFYARYFTELSLPLIVYAGNFATWQMFFVLGLYLGKLETIKISNKTLIIFILAFYILSCMESYLLITFFQQAEDAVTAVKASSFMYSFFMIVLFFKNKGLFKSKLLKEIGIVSFGIYLVHMFALLAVSKMLLILYSSLKDITYIYQLSLIFIATLCCYVVISLFNKYCKVNYSRLIGFK